MKKFKWLIYGLTVIFLFGCGSPGGGGDPRKPGGGNEPVRLPIPDHKEPAAPGFLEQLAWGGLGGGEEPQIPQKCGDCRVNLEGNRISFSDFRPSQELRVVIYRVTGRENCAFGVAEYVTMLPVRVAERGNLTVELDGPTKDISVVFVLDAETDDRIWVHPAVSSEPLNCPP